MPNRISFKVSATVDSRTILDQPGAEKLLGRGDMLFMEEGSRQPERGQGAVAVPEEIRRVLGWWRANGCRTAPEAGLARALIGPQIESSQRVVLVPPPGRTTPNRRPDPLFQAAALLVVAERQGSVERLDTFQLMGAPAPGRAWKSPRRRAIAETESGG